MLLARFLEQGLAAGLWEEVHRSRPAGLTGALCAQNGPGPAYVGRGRAIDLVVNAVLPFMHAWEESEPRGAITGVPEGIYARYPLLSENEITREMAAQLLPAGWRRAVSNAKRQQGLLHLSDLLKGRSEGASPRTDSSAANLILFLSLEARSTPTQRRRH
jgi:hypothetical protein